MRLSYHTLSLLAQSGDEAACKLLKHCMTQGCWPPWRMWVPCWDRVRGYVAKKEEW